MQKTCDIEPYQINFHSFNISKIDEYLEIRNNKEFNERINKIYGLIDPRDNSLFYIGCTISSMHVRLSQHFSTHTTVHHDKRKILHDILSDGLFPKIQIFYKIEDKYTARIVEKYITNFVYLNDRDIKLTNVAGTQSEITNKVNLKK